uniref:Putative uncharacterized protein n=1 Tax=Cricetid gammaherpesvirus 2 TaxID=1605972 RepID=UPI000716C819|nr:Chain A, Viral chemokine binding protein R17 encoded by rodent gammaherpesvirus Peru (RHVP) [Cricetid gammaherpesvirus 2]
GPVGEPVASEINEASKVSSRLLTQDILFRKDRQATISLPIKLPVEDIITQTCDKITYGPLKFLDLLEKETAVLPLSTDITCPACLGRAVLVGKWECPAHVAVNESDLTVFGPNKEEHVPQFVTVQQPSDGKMQRLFFAKFLGTEESLAVLRVPGPDGHLCIQEALIHFKELSGAGVCSLWKANDSREEGLEMKQVDCLETTVLENQTCIATTLSKKIYHRLYCGERLMTGGQVSTRVLLTALGFYKRQPYTFHRVPKGMVYVHLIDSGSEDYMEYSECEEVTPGRYEDKQISYTFYTDLFQTADGEPVLASVWGTSGLKDSAYESCAFVIPTKGRRKLVPRRIMSKCYPFRLTYHPSTMTVRLDVRVEKHHGATDQGFVFLKMESGTYSEGREYYLDRVLWGEDSSTNNVLQHHHHHHHH